MKLIRLLTGLCALTCLLPGLPALGLANRVFVSQRSGNNANSCDNITTPCQTFAGAVLQLNAGGEVIVVDSGGYGPVTITQGVTIEAPPGVVAFIHPPAGDGITVNAGFSDAVVLRGLVLNGGTNGIVVNSVGSLHIENCVINGVGNDGIQISINVPNSSVFLKDTISRQNFVGFRVLSGHGTVDHCRFEGNADGILVDGADVTVRDSVAARNSHIGLSAISLTTESTVLNVYASLAANNGDGFYAAGNGGPVTARIANSSIIENGGIGLYNGGNATFESLGNNFVRGNVGGDASGPITVVSPH